MVCRTSTVIYGTLTPLQAYSSNVKTTSEHKQDGDDALTAAFDAFHEAAMPTRRDEVAAVAKYIFDEVMEVPLVDNRFLHHRKIRKQDALEALASAWKSYTAAGESGIAERIAELGTDIVSDDEWSDLTGQV